MSIKSAIGALGTVAGVVGLFNKNNKTPNSKINNFQAELRKNGIARTNLFEVVITPPIVLSGNKTADKISLYAEGAQLPGRSINTGDLKRYGVGPSEKIPYAMSFNDLTLSFIGDGQGEIYKFFYNWMQGIVRGDSSASTYGSEIDKNGKTAFEVEFKENYAVIVDIFTFNEVGEPILNARLYDAFPINVPEVSLNWSDGGMMQFSATFAYFQTELMNSETAIKTSASNIKELSTLQKLVKIGTAVQTIASLKKPSSIQAAIASASSVKNVFNGF